MSQATYSTNSDLYFDTGKALDELFDASLTSVQIETFKDKARLRAYNFINSRYLEGKTVIPATGITELKQIEIDLCIADLMQDAFSLQTANTSEWADKYKQRAEESLKNLKFDAIAETPSADSQNIGNGTISVITTNNFFTRTEQWVLRATSATKFSVYGSLTGYLPEAEVGVQYPESDWTCEISDYGLNFTRTFRYEQYPVSFLITAGATAFQQDDRFAFKTYQSTFYKPRNGRLIRS